MTSPLAKGLFHAAVDMSGSSVLNASLERAEDDNLVFLKRTGCRDRTCLRHLSVKQVLQVGGGVMAPITKYSHNISVFYKNSSSLC